jgi:hypothetical protein
VSINVDEVLWLKLGIFINSFGLCGVLTNRAFFPVGEYNLSSVGPNKPKVGIPVAADKCIKPESLPIKILDNENIAAVGKIGWPTKLIGSISINFLYKSSPTFSSPGPPTKITLPPFSSSKFKILLINETKLLLGQTFAGQFAVAPIAINGPCLIL